MTRFSSLVFCFCLFVYQTAQAQARLAWQPDDFGLQLVEGQDTSQVLQISNLGQSVLSVHVLTQADQQPNFISLLSVPLSFVQPGQTESLELNFSAFGFMSGVYQGHLTLVSSDPDQPYAQVAATMEVTDYFPDLKFPWPTGEEWELLTSYQQADHDDQHDAYYALDWRQPGPNNSQGGTILSASAGQVSRVFSDSEFGWGLEIEVMHGYVVQYRHLASLMVALGQTVRQGQILGQLGTTAETNFDHLHFVLLYYGHCLWPLLQSRPEPLSGFCGFAHATGLFYLSDNELVDNSAGLAKESVNKSLSLAISPNPFNQQVQIAFILKQDMLVRLAIYNLLGEEVELLKEGNLVAGKQQFIWLAENFASGIYFVSMQADQVSLIQQVLLVK